MKKKIKDYYLIFDVFGIIPVWSLQHPKKGAEEGYLIPFNNIELTDKDWYQQIYQFYLAHKMYLDYEITITGELTFEIQDKQKIITDLKIDYLTLYSHDYLYPRIMSDRQFR